jgi:D-aminopeptidase
MPRPRAREIGLAEGELPTGPLNAITDVPGVLVGHATIATGAGSLVPGQGPARTGVTVVLPHGDNLFREKVPAAVHTINGFGKAVGFEQVRELGALESPIALTNTLNVGLVADALVQHAIAHSPEIGITAISVNVLVGECNDGFLNDLQGRHVRAEHVLAAIESATPGSVAEGAVGAGAGTVCFGWKGGIGTASRVLPPAIGGWTLGALAQTNFGRPHHLTIRGVPVGGHLLPPNAAPLDTRDAGSVVVVLATDAPLSDRQLRRLCVRVAAGLARTGSVYGHGSGDFAIAFSTAERIPHQPRALTIARTVVADEARVLDWLFLAVVESVEEAVINSLCAAETVVGRDGNTAHALPLDDVYALVSQARRL